MPFSSIVIATCLVAGRAMTPHLALSTSLQGLQQERHAAPAAPFGALPRRGSLLGDCDGFDCVLRYVALPDSRYAWQDTGVRISGRDAEIGMSWEGHVLNMTSQKWLSGEEVSHPVWWHILVVIVPEKVEFNDWATVNLAFGYYDERGRLRHVENRAPRGPDPMITTPINMDNLQESIPGLVGSASLAAYAAVRTRAVGVCLLDAWNGYERYAKDATGAERSQDSFKSRAYLEFLSQPSRPELLAELPGVKAVVRALDTVTAHSSGRIRRFGVVGYSKLGTLTYLTGAADSRVKLIAPGSIYTSFWDCAPSILGPSAGFIQAAERDPALVQQAAERNPALFAQLGRALSQKTQKGTQPAWGGFSPIITPSVAEAAETLMYGKVVGDQYHEVVSKVGTPAAKKMMSIIDPLSWPERLQNTSLFTFNAQSDPIIPMSVHLLEEQRHKEAFPSAWTLGLPNCSHDDSPVCGGPQIAAFIRGHLLGRSPPRLAWDPPAPGAHEGGPDHMRVSVAPAEVGSAAPRAHVWRAPFSKKDGVTGMDWRPLGATMSESSAGVFEVDVPPLPTSSGIVATAYFMRVEFPDWPEPGLRFAASTPLRVFASAKAAFVLNGLPPPQ